MKKLCILLAALLLVLSFAACSSSEEGTAARTVLGTEGIVAAKDLKPTSASDKEKLGYQLEMPEKGEEICILHTNHGDIKIRLFPDAAPKAVYNFKSLVISGYYDGIVFHRVMDDFMIQGGDPTATGRGGESIWGEKFDDEFHTNLVNISGSLSCANSGPNTNGSQFFINAVAPGGIDWDYYEFIYTNYYEPDPETFAYYYQTTLDTTKVTEEYKKIYNEHGGNVHLDGAYSTAGRGHTVFGQVFEGMDVVQEIEKVETDEDDKPLQDCVILSAEIVPYE